MRKWITPSNVLFIISVFLMLGSIWYWALLGVSKEVGLAMFATTTTSFLVSWIIWAWETL